MWANHDLPLCGLWSTKVKLHVWFVSVGWVLHILDIKIHQLNGCALWISIKLKCNASREQDFKTWREPELNTANSFQEAGSKHICFDLTTSQIVMTTALVMTSCWSDIFNVVVFLPSCECALWPHEHANYRHSFMPWKREWKAWCFPLFRANAKSNM